MSQEGDNPRLLVYNCRPVDRLTISKSWVVLDSYKTLRLEKLEGLKLGPLPRCTLISRNYCGNKLYRIIHTIRNEQWIVAESDDPQAIRTYWFNVSNDPDLFDDYRVRVYGCWINPDEPLRGFRCGGFEESVTLHREVTEYIQVFYGTNRFIQPDEAILFGNGPDLESQDPLHLGLCQVRIPPNHQHGKVRRKDWKIFRKPDDTSLAITYFSELKEEGFAHKLRQFLPLTDRKDIFLFIHGFKVRFSSAVIRTAQIALDIEWDGISACYSWPTAAKLSEYSTDAIYVKEAVLHFRRYVEILTRQLPDGGRVHIVCHSMGGRLVSEALQDFDIDISRKLGHIIFAAADVEVNAFQRLTFSYAQRMLQWTGRQPKFSLYACKQDLALFGSCLVNGIQPRCGANPPLEGFEHIRVVEVQSLDSPTLRSTKHGYIYSDVHVMDNIRCLLSESHEDIRQISNARFKLKCDMWK